MSDEKRSIGCTIPTGIGFFPLMFLILFTLKLCGVIDWMSWWWVTAPLWAPAGIALVAFLLFLVGTGSVVACFIIWNMIEKTMRIKP